MLTVDLWNADGTGEVNLVKHSSTSPSISTATNSSYPPPPQTLSPMYPPNPHYGAGQAVGYPMNSYYGGNAHLANSNPYPQAAYYSQYYPGGGHVPPAANFSPAVQPLSSVGMFTRNLIGSLSASAFRLTDPTNRIGVWFILQDLSVRTEGLFRYVYMYEWNAGTVC